MLRKILPLMLLLVFVSSDSAIARRHRRCCPQQVQFGFHAEPVSPKIVPDYCLRDIYMEFPSPPHLYYCRTYDDKCAAMGESYDDLWYGYPTHIPPQECGNNNCEGQPAKGIGYGMGHGEPAPGHGHPFKRSRARDWLKDNYPEGDPGSLHFKYYKITSNDDSAPIPGQPYYAVMVEAHAPNSGGPRHFGVQVTKLDGSWEDLRVENGKVKGKVLRFDADIDHSATKGLVWLE